MENLGICCSRWVGIVLMKNLGICVFLIWYLRWKFPYPLSYPLLIMVFYGIKWEINPKLVKIDWKCIEISGIWMEFMKFEIAVVWSLDLQLFEWHLCWFSGDRSKYCWWNFWDFVFHLETMWNAGMKTVRSRF